MTPQPGVIRSVCVCVCVDLGGVDPPSVHRVDWGCYDHSRRCGLNGSAAGGSALLPPRLSVDVRSLSRCQPFSSRPYPLVLVPGLGVTPRSPSRAAMNLQLPYYAPPKAMSRRTSGGLATGADGDVKSPFVVGAPFYESEQLGSHAASLLRCRRIQLRPLRRPLYAYQRR